MGKTVASYRLALEKEIERWKSFRQALGSQEDREAFDELMDACRNNASASGNACNPVIFEPMVMSIVLAQEKRILELGYGLNEVFWQRSRPQRDSSEGENHVKLCTTCNAEVLVGAFHCPSCKIYVCFYCGMEQISNCHDVQVLKSGSLPFCPKCGGKLD